MALRPQRKRQGGSPNGRGVQTVGTVVSKPGQGGVLNQPGKKVGFTNQPGAAPGVVTPPSATYLRAPPPVPSPATPGPTSTALRANATSALGLAQGQNRDSIFRALMQLGDPTQFGQYQNNPNFAGYQFAQDPNSVFASLGRQETKGLQDVDQGTLAGNTFFSGRRLQDRQDLSDEANRQRLAGTTSFLDDLRNFAATLGGANNQYRQDMADADQSDIDAALERDRVAREEASVGSSPVAGPNPTVPGMTPTQVQAAINFLGNPNFGQDLPGLNPSRPLQGYTNVQTTGSRAGQSYKVVMKNGKKYKYYSGGDKVLFS